jgi:pilus assembly protein FimV
MAGDQSVASKEAATRFDSDATMVMEPTEDTVITEAGPSAAVDEEAARDDVIAEADVYLAYGIYQQAEELLTQAIADNPNRDDYRVKLAETYYASKNAEAFVEVASEIKKRAASDDAPAWKKVMVMGQDLCADNPMFQGSMVGGLDVGSLAPAAPSMDFDLGMDEAEDTAASDLDLSLDDEQIELPDLDEEFGSETGEEELPEESSFEEIDELEFDLSDTGAVEETAAEDEFSLDIDASELDIDIQDEKASTEATDSDEESMELGDIDLGLDLDTEEAAAEEVTDVGDIDIDFGMEEESPAAEDEEEISLDLSDEEESMEMEFGEELDTESATEIEEAAEIPSDAYGELTDEEDFDLSSLDDVDEISTKLDLARAYLDMGDHEGTRSILEEVIAEGNDEQKEEAKELMSKLD